MNPPPARTSLALTARGFLQLTSDAKDTSGNKSWSEPVHVAGPVDGGVLDWTRGADITRSSGSVGGTVNVGE